MNNNPDYNIEFSHIYVNEEFGKEQIESIKILKKLIKKLDNESKTYSLNVLIDDYHVYNKDFNIKEIANLLSEYNIKVDNIIFESSLIKFAKKFIKHLPRKKIIDMKMHNGEKILFEKDDKEIQLIEKKVNGNIYSCSLLLCCWYLSRLGVKEFNIKSKSGKKIIQILPLKYKNTEDKALLLLKSTKFKRFADRIEYLFY